MKHPRRTLSNHKSIILNAAQKRYFKESAQVFGTAEGSKRKIGRLCSHFANLEEPNFSEEVSRHATAAQSALSRECDLTLALEALTGQKDLLARLDDELSARTEALRAHARLVEKDKQHAEKVP